MFLRRILGIFTRRGGVDALEDREHDWTYLLRKIPLAAAARTGNR